MSPARSLYLAELVDDHELLATDDFHRLAPLARDLADLLPRDATAAAHAPRDFQEDARGPARDRGADRSERQRLLVLLGGFFYALAELRGRFPGPERGAGLGFGRRRLGAWLFGLFGFNRVAHARAEREKRDDDSLGHVLSGLRLM